MYSQKTPNFIGVVYLNYAEQKALPKTNKFARHLPSIPKSFSQVASHPDKGKIYEAMAKELISQFGLKTMESVDIPWEKVKGRRIKLFNLIWAYDIKLVDGKFAEWKARLCFQGSDRKSGVHHSIAEIFTHVLRLQSLRMVMARWINKIPGPGMGIGCELLDIKTAFIRAILNKLIYIRPPPGVQDGMEKS